MNISKTLFKAPANNEVSGNVKQNKVNNGNSKDTGFKEMLSKAITNDTKKDNKVEESKAGNNAKVLNKDKTENEGKFYTEIEEKELNPKSLEPEESNENEIKIDLDFLINENKNINKEQLREQEKNIQELAGVLNKIIELLTKDNEVEKENVTESNLKTLKNSISPKLKNVLNSLKNAKSIKDIKDALNELEKLSNDKNFQKLIKLVDDEIDTKKGNISELIKDLPKLVKKFKSIMKKLNENKSVISGSFLDDLKKESEKAIKKDYETRFENRKSVDNGSRHRKTSSSFSENEGNQESDENASQHAAQNANQNGDVKNYENNFNFDSSNGKSQFANEIGKNISSNTFSSILQAVSKDVLNQVLKNVKIATNGNKKELMINIRPPELGKVKLKLSVENGKVIAKFGVENEKVQQILENNRLTLTKQLEESGLSVEQIDIDLDQGTGHNQEQKEFMQRLKDNVINKGKSGSLQAGGEKTVSSEDDYVVNTYDVNDYLATQVSLTV